MTDEEVLPEHEHPVEDEQPSAQLVETSVWRLGSVGLLLNGVMEEHAPWLAEHEPSSIFFYADLTEPIETPHAP